MLGGGFGGGGQESIEGEERCSVVGVRRMNVDMLLLLPMSGGDMI